MERGLKAWDRFIAVGAAMLLMAWCTAYFMSVLLDHASFELAFVQGPEESVLVLLGAKLNALLSEGDFHRLAVAAFLHSNLEHLLVNATLLVLLAWSYARARQSGTDFTLLFLIGAVGGKMLSYVLGMGPSVGASGGIFALMGGLLASLWMDTQARLTRRVLVVLFVPMGVLALVGEQVDHAAHLGGMVLGTVWGLFVSSKSEQKPVKVVYWAAVLGTLLITATGLVPSQQRLEIPLFDVNSSRLGADVDLQECARLEEPGTASCVYEPGLLFAADLTPEDLLRRGSFETRLLPRTGTCHTLTHGYQNLIMHRPEHRRIRLVATDIHAWPLFRESIGRLIVARCLGM